MSREIKFRVWDTRTGKMIDPDRRGDDLVMDMDGELKWYKEHEYQGGCLDLSGTGSLVLMQFTGKVDKNSNDIYEGDKLRHPDEYDPMTVVWHEPTAGFGLDKKGWAYIHYFREAVEASDCEVIGNIYEHPDELLKK